PAAVRKITTVEPNTGMNAKARRRIQQSKIPVEQRSSAGERLPFEDAQFDCAVSTFTLCSVRDPDQVMRELFRVLKHGGLFLVLEHGLSSDAKIQKWQHRLNGLQKWCGDGCHLDRDMNAIIAHAPFANIELEHFYLEKTPKILGYLYRGYAGK